MRRDYEKQKAWQQRSKPLNRESKKRRAERPARKAILDEVVRGKPCFAQFSASCTGWAQDGHEIIPRGRLPGSHLIKAAVRGVCHPCHTEIGERPEEANRRGLLLHLHEWNLLTSALSETHDSSPLLGDEP